MVATLPTGRTGQALALAIAVVLVLVLWTGIVSPAVDLYRERAERLDHLMQVSERMEALSAELPALQTRAQALAKEGQLQVTTIAGASDAVAEANLQNMVRETSAQKGAKLTSVESVDPDVAANGYRRVGIHVSLSTSWAGLIDLLRSSRESQVPMLIDDLQIHAPRLLAPNAAPVLTAEFTVYAFRAASPAEAK